jgi:putative transposase
MDIFQLIQDGKISRYFRSRKKLFQAGLVSHITQRAAGKDILFIDDDDYRSMLALMKELSEKYTISVYAFCLMPNHIHLLIRPDKNNLDQFIRDLCGRYATRFNRRYERRGHLFGGPFRQAVVFDDAYLLAVSLYIHLNPVRAGLVSEPGNYRFSSSRLYTTSASTSAFVTPDAVLSLLSETHEERRRKYGNLLERGKAIKSDNVLEDERAIERFIISLKALRLPFLSGFIKKDEEPSAPPSSDTLEEDIMDFENIRGLRKPEGMKAKKYLVEQLIARGYTITQVADHLGIARKTVYNILAYAAAK